MHTNQFKLLTTKRYLPLLITSFGGKLNDHLLKFLLLIYVFTLFTHNTLIALATLAFLVPLLIFSRQAGILADTSEKSINIRRIKIFELLITIFIAIAVMNHNVWLLLFTIFALGVKVAYFLPFKHSILPQLVSKDELMAGNAFMNIATFSCALLAIISYLLWGIYLMVITMIVVAAIGLISSYFIPPAEALTEDKYSYVFFEQNRIILFCMLCIGWFWFSCYTYLSLYLQYTDLFFNGINDAVYLVSALVSGVTIGSFLPNIILRSEIKLTLLPLSLLLMILFSTDLYFSTTNFSLPMILLDLFMIGVSAGMFIVPLYATLQYRSVPMYRARNIALSSTVNVKSIILSYVLVLSLAHYKISALGAILMVPISGTALLAYISCRRS